MAPVDGIAPAGLCSALVLIGAYDRETGCPVLGVINEPFFRRDPLTRRYRHRLGGHGRIPAPKGGGKPGDPVTGSALRVPVPAGGRGGTTGVSRTGTRGCAR